MEPNTSPKTPVEVQIEQINIELSNLESRLSGVVRPAAPKPEASPANALIALQNSDLVTTLKRFVARLGTLNDNLEL
jgi:hypothetical protein